MATIKSFTDLEQSKKLVEILPLESADYHYITQGEKSYFYPYSLTSDAIKDYDEEIKHVPCWSLAALLSVLPEGTRLLKATNISSIGDTKYHCDCPKCNIDVWFDNPIDACYEVIIKLYELKML